MVYEPTEMNSQRPRKDYRVLGHESVDMYVRAGSLPENFPQLRFKM